MTDEELKTVVAHDYRPRWQQVLEHRWTGYAIKAVATGLLTFLLCFASTFADVAFIVSMGWLWIKD